MKLRGAAIFLTGFINTVIFLGGVMKIFNVLWNDRHTDTTATPFLDFSKAKLWARQQAEECCHFPEDLKETPIDGWLYHIEYSCEGDSLWITEHDI